MMAKMNDMSVMTVPAPPPEAAGALLATGLEPAEVFPFAGAAAPDGAGAAAPPAFAGAPAAGAAAAALGAAGPPGFGAFSLTVGDAVCLGGKLILTVCFFWDWPAGG